MNFLHLLWNKEHFFLGQGFYLTGKAWEKWAMGAGSHLPCREKMLYVNIIDSDSFLRVIGPINSVKSCLSYMIYWRHAKLQQ